MQFTPIRPDAIKYEMRMVSGEDPFAVQKKTPGAFGRFLSGVGRFFSAIAAPFSLIFPPAAIGAAGMYGIGQIGDQMQYKQYLKMQQQQQTPQYISYPGLDMSPSSGGVTPARMPGLELSQQQQTVMDVLYARNDMMLESAHKL